MHAPSHNVRNVKCNTSRADPHSLTMHGMRWPCFTRFWQGPLTDTLPKVNTMPATLLKVCPLLACSSHHSQTCFSPQVSGAHMKHVNTESATLQPVNNSTKYHYTYCTVRHHAPPFKTVSSPTSNTTTHQIPQGGAHDPPTKGMHAFIINQTHASL